MRRRRLGSRVKICDYFFVQQPIKKVGGELKIARSETLYSFYPWEGSILNIIANFTRKNLETCLAIKTQLIGLVDTII